MASQHGNAATSPRHAAFAAFLGSTVEYYDFLLYTVAAALVFPHVFFPHLASGVGTIASFGTLAAGYFARPLGAIVCGHYGDRLGRKGLLVVTMLMMGIGSFLMGLLPTYDSVGVAAPVLLVVLRILQGFATGGEWGGSVLIATEAAPQRKGGFFGGFTQAGGPAGSLLATVFMTLLSHLPNGEFLSWGWRIPFLCSAVLVVVGLIVRMRLRETSEFAETRKSHETVAAPIATVLTRHTRNVILAILVGLGGLVLQGLMATYMLSYATDIGYSTSATLNIKIVMTIGNFVGVLFFAWASDAIGKRRSIVIGSVLFAITAFPLFAVANSGHAVAYGAAMTIVYTVVHPLMFAPLAGLLSEMFPVNVRYTGSAVSYQMSSVLGAGLGPLIASSLLTAAGGGTHSGSISVFMIGVAVVTLVAALIARSQPTDEHAGAVSTKVGARV